MASLTGTKIKDTYDALLKVSDNGALDGTLQTITDGLGNNSALSLSTAGASVGGTLAVSGAATLSGGVSGNVAFDTNTLFVDAANNMVGVGTSSPTVIGGFSGLTIDNSNSGSILDLNKSGTNAIRLLALSTGDQRAYFAGSASIYTADTVRINIKDGGDISFRDSSANEAFYWDASTSRLGIGLTTPSDGIEVSNGGIKVSPNPTALANGYNASFTTFYAEEVLQMLVNGNKAITVKGYNVPSSLHFYTYSGGSSSERMRIDSSGNVLVGTQTALSGSTNRGNVTISGSDSAILNVAYNNTASGYIYCDASGTEMGEKRNAYFKIHTNSTERMRIDSSGRVGIGTSSVDSNLVVNGSSNVRVNLKSGDVRYGTIFADSGVLALSSITPIPLVLATNDTERMRITSGGYLKASNTGTYNGSTGDYHELRTNISGGYILYATNTSAAPQGVVVEYPSVSPNGTENWFYYAGDSSSARFIVRSNGGISNYQANDTNLSDERVKTDISPLGSYWDKIKAIEIVNFKYIDQSHDDFNIGVIAQQVESIAPEFVDADGFDNRPKLISEEVIDEEGNVIQEAVYEEPLAEPLKAVYTADLYHAAIKVLQEAMARIEVLETELNALKQA